MKKNKVIILILAISLLCAGYIIYRSYSVQAQILGRGNLQTSDRRTSNTGNNPRAAVTPPAVGPLPSEMSATADCFTFDIQADSHLDPNTDIDLYKQTLLNIARDKPSFLMDLGDTFMAEKYAKTQQEVEQRYIEAKSYFASLGMIPLHLVTGNHDGEIGWDAGNGQNNMLNWARSARLKYFPAAANETLFSGNTTTANYYSFVKGDAQFIVLDPFTYSTKKPKSDNEGWNYTLGKTQYDWLKSTLENSIAKYKFVFIHNLVGGYGKDARGGAEAARFFEWGGYSPDGSYDFDNMRPGWGKPIHQLMVDNNVTAVFHGHDHFYGKQNLDGIIYQLVPQPGTPGNSVGDAAQYSYKDGMFLPSAGYLRVTVSDSKASVEYVKSFLSADANGSIQDSYAIYPKTEGNGGSQQ